MLQQLFGTELAFPIRVAVALGVVAALLGVTVVVMRRLAARSRANTSRGKPGPRLAVIDSVTVDQRRKLVLVRRDEVEHLLLIGGNSDIVVEPAIGAAPDVPAAVAPASSFAPAVLASGRETASLQRSAPRQRLSPSAASTAASLAAPSEPAATEDVAAPAPGVASPAEAAPADQPSRRLPLGRKPLLRGDGTMSVARSPQRAATPAPTGDDAEVDVAPAPAAPSIAPPVSAGPAPVAPAVVRETEPSRRVPAFEPRPEPRAETSTEVRSERTPDPAPVTLLAAEAAPSAVPPVAAGNRIDMMAQRLDAALKEPAPQLSLSDLLDDVEEAQPKAAPAEPVAPEPVAERPPARFALRPRNEPRVGFEAGRGRTEPLPRFERPAVPARSETPLRPREFAFRSGTASESEARPDETRRELPSPREPALREPILREPALKVTDSAADLRKTFDVAPRPAVDAAEPKVAAPAPRASDAPAIPAEPAPPDPLDDFDAEMANLLGRNTARNR